MLAYSSPSVRRSSPAGAIRPVAGRGVQLWGRGVRRSGSMSTAGTPKTNEYSTAAVSGRFDRLEFGRGKSWERLAGGPGLQGLGLAADRGKIYRVGEMEPRNEPGSRPTTIPPRFRPARSADKEMGAVAAAPRGALHYIAVVGDTLFVVGGWSMMAIRERPARYRVGNGSDGRSSGMEETQAALRCRCLPPLHTRAKFMSWADSTRMTKRN